MENTLNHFVLDVISIVNNSSETLSLRFLMEINLW